MLMMLHLLQNNQKQSNNCCSTSQGCKFFCGKCRRQYSAITHISNFENIANYVDKQKGDVGNHMGIEVVGNYYSEKKWIL